MKPRGLFLLFSLFLLLSAAVRAEDAPSAPVLEMVWVRCDHVPRTQAEMEALASRKEYWLTKPLRIELSLNEERKGRWEGKRVRVPTEISEKGKVTRRIYRRPHLYLTAYLRSIAPGPSYSVLATYDSLLPKTPAVQVVARKSIPIPQFDVVAGNDSPLVLEEGEWQPAFNTETSAYLTSHLLLVRARQR
ncbi:MAG: hypothetical protein PW734_00370 [Verrucomicrobium sp.]|nr:hypothetical protein [Verrucomicrobium sp.]